MDCGKITQGFVGGACGALPIGGTGTRVMLLNYSDVLKSTSEFDESTSTISDIKLKSGAKGYLYETIENADEASATYSKGTYTSQYDHSVTLRIFKDTIEAKTFVNQMKDARVIAIVEKRGSGNNKWEVYGWESGLKLSENTYSTTFTDNVAFAPVLASDDTSKETMLPYSFYTGSEEATEAAVLALAQE